MEQGPTHFPSKRDGWLTVVLWIAATMCVAGGLVQLAVAPGVLGIVFLLLMSGAASLVLWVLYGTRYTFAGDLLDIRSGPFRFKVPIAEVVSVEPTRSPLSSPACSLERLLIRYGTRQIMVSPADRSTFLDTLARRSSGLTRSGDRLLLSPRLRPATPDDVESIATVWHDGWRDGHLGHVPEAIEPHRRLAHFRARVPPRIPATTVATSGPRVIGFVTVHEDEVEQIYVAREARGGGAAAALLRHAEQAIAARFAVAWLAVVAGNARARRFYERNGWRDAGAFEYAAEITNGTMLVPCHRYEKRVRPTGV